MITDGINAIIYPPVGPRRTEIPLLNEEKTGSPITPAEIYRSRADKLFFKSRAPAVKKTANSWSVKDIPERKGTDIYEQTAKKAALKEISVIFFVISVLVLRGFIGVLLFDLYYYIICGSFLQSKTKKMLINLYN